MRENTDQKNSEYEHFLRIKMFDWFLSTPLNLLQMSFQELKEYGKFVCYEAPTR